MLTPNHTQLQISIPKSLVGKEVEVQVRARVKKEKKTPTDNISKLRGTLHLSVEQAKEFRAYSKNIRAEWERNIL